MEPGETTEGHDAELEPLMDLTRRVEALERAIRQLTEEVQRLYESEEFR